MVERLTLRFCPAFIVEEDSPGRTGGTGSSVGGRKRPQYRLLTDILFTGLALIKIIKEVTHGR